MQTWQLPGNRKEKRNILMDSKRRLQKKKGIERWCSENSVGILEKPAFRRSGVPGVSGIIPEIASTFFHESLNDVQTESTQRSGEGSGTSLQYSCLGKPMDRGAWRAAALSTGSQRVRHDWAAERAGTRPSPPHRPFPPSLSASSAPRGPHETPPRLLCRGRFRAQLPRGHRLQQLLGTVVPSGLCGSAAPPLSGSSPSASQPQRHRLPPLFTPAHGSHSFRCQTLREERPASLSCSHFFSMPHLARTHCTLFPDVPLESQAEGVSKRITSSPEDLLLWCSPALLLALSSWSPSLKETDCLRFPLLCSLDLVIKLFCLSSIPGSLTGTLTAPLRLLEQSLSYCSPWLQYLVYNVSIV